MSPAVAVDDVVFVHSLDVNPREPYRVVAFRPGFVSKRTGRTIAAQFDAFSANAGRKHGDSTLRSFFLTDIRAVRGGDDVTTAKKSKARKPAAKKASKAAQPKGLRGSRNAERDAQIVKLTKDGKTKAEVGEKFGISPNAVHGVLWRATHK